MNQKGLARVISAMLACAALFGAVGCSKKTNEEPPKFEETHGGGLPDYDIGNIEKYVKPFKYTGYTVYYGMSESKQEKVWEAVLGGAEIIAYPTAQVEYYAEQERAKYRYYASRDGVGYNELLDALGVTEESIYENARALVKDDLILAYIAKDAKISLSDEEKSKYYEKYVGWFEELGYDRNYVYENMSDQIYDMMLKDKIMEYLVKNNTAYTPQSK